MSLGTSQRGGMSLNENPVFLTPGSAFSHIKSHFFIEHCAKFPKKTRKVILKDTLSSKA